MGLAIAQDPAAYIQDRPLGYITNVPVSITTPIASIYVGLSRAPAGILNPFWIQVAVSEAKRPSWCST
jgi:hypothetical protein